MSEENKAIIRRNYTEIWNGGKLDVADEIYASDHVNHDPANPGVSGPDGYKQLVGMYRAAFPDTNFTVEELIAEGDRVVTRWTARGTQKGELQGIPATNKQVEVSGMTIDRIAGGKIAESWSNWDTLGMMQQLGVAPGPE